jgi:hypothetical protein
MSLLFYLSLILMGGAVIALIRKDDSLAVVLSLTALALMTINLFVPA